MQYLNSVTFFQERYKKYTDEKYKQIMKDTIGYNNITNFANYEQREYDYDELERELLAAYDYEAEKITIMKKIMKTMNKCNKLY